MITCGTVVVRRTACSRGRTRRSVRIVLAAGKVTSAISHDARAVDDAVAQFILQHYTEWYRDRPIKPPLLFIVGEQRRDIILNTLMDANLPTESRIQVDEVVVYGTGVMESL